MQTRRASAVAFLAAAALVAAAGTAQAAISNTTVDGQVVTNDVIREARVTNSDVTHSSLAHARIVNSHVGHAQIAHASVSDSYLDHLRVEKALVEDSRVENARLSDVTLRDVTLCDASVTGERAAGECALVSANDDGVTEHAWLHEDAPDTVAPGESFDVRVSVAESGALKVWNDPAGLTALGFDPTAADAAVDRIEVWVDGESMGEVGLGEEFDLEDATEFTLRVFVAESGLTDGSTLGLVVDVGGHGLRTNVATIDVLATALAFAPLEQQAFAPYLSDNVARLVISVGVDENGNVDRDLDVAYTVDVLQVATGHDKGRGPNVGEDVQHHAGLHGDAELFSDNPIGYSNPESLSAHHPATLEFILRDLVGVEGITYGATNFYATHLVTQSPYYTKVMLHASATNAEGDELEAEPIEIELGRLPDEERSASTPFGPLGEPVFPGEGMLRVKFVDSDGNAVNREAGWTLSIQETPDSHRTTMHILYDEDGGSVDEQPLAASQEVGLPFGDFVPHEYKVCLHHDGKESCANDGELVAIETGETTEVEIVVE